MNLKTTYKHRWNNVRPFWVSPHGKYLLRFVEKGVELWSLVNKKRIRTIALSSSVKLGQFNDGYGRYGVNSYYFSLDDTTLIMPASDNDQQLQVIDLNTGLTRCTIPLPSYGEVGVTNQGKFIGFRNREKIDVIDGYSGRQLFSVDGSNFELDIQGRFVSVFEEKVEWKPHRQVTHRERVYRIPDGSTVDVTPFHGFQSAGGENYRHKSRISGTNSQFVAEYQRDDEVWRVFDLQSQEVIVTVPAQTITEENHILLGSKFITKSDESTAQVWNLNTREIELTIPLHYEYASLKLSSDRTLLAVQVEVSIYRIWDLNTFEELKPINGFPLYHFSSSYVLVGDGRNRYFLLETETGREVQHVDGKLIKVVADGSFALFRMPDETISILELMSRGQKKPELTSLKRSYAAQIIQYAPAVRWILLLSDAGNVHIYDANGKMVGHFGQSVINTTMYWIESCQIVGQHFFTTYKRYESSVRSEKEYLQLSRLSDGIRRHIWRYPIDTRFHRSKPAISEDGRIIISKIDDRVSETRQKESMKFFVWNADSPDIYLIREHEHFEKSANCIITPSNQQFVTTRYYGSSNILVWDTYSAEIMQEFWENGRITALALSKNGKLLISGVEDGVCSVRELRSGNRLVSFTHPTSAEINSIYLVNNGEYIATSTQDAVHVWNLATGDLMFSIPDTGESRYKILNLERGRDFSSRYIVIFNFEEGIISVFSSRNGQSKFSHSLGIDYDPNTLNIHLSPDERFLAVHVRVQSEEASYIDLFNLRTGNLEFRHQLPNVHINSMCFSDDSRQILVVGGDGEFYYDEDGFNADYGGGYILLLELPDET